MTPPEREDERRIRPGPAAPRGDDSEAEPEIAPPGAFFLAQREALRETAPLGPVLDLACGRGRHSLAAAALGLEVLALDRSREALGILSAAAPPDARIECREADLETGAPPALPRGGFGAVLVFRYLHRPLTPWIASLLAPGGLLLYETFTVAQRTLGWGPKRDAFLLEPDELPRLFPGLEIEHHAEGPNDDDPPAMTARLRARKPRAGA